MSFFNVAPQKQNDEDWKSKLAYIDKDTRELSKKGDEVVKEACKVLLPKALALMDEIKGAGLLTEGKNQNGETYTNKMIVHVAPQTEKQVVMNPVKPNEPLRDSTGEPMKVDVPRKLENGKIAYNAELSLSCNGVKLKVKCSPYPYKTEDGKAVAFIYGDGVEASKFNSNTKSFTNAKGNEAVQKADWIPDELKKTAQLVLDSIPRKEISEKTLNFARELNEAFGNGEKVMATVKVYENKQPVLNADGTNKTEEKLVPVCRAKPQKDTGYGESVQIFNRVEKTTVIQLGVKDGEPTVSSADLTQNREGKPRQEGEKARVFWVNNERDAAAYVPEIPELQKAVCDYKGLDIEKVKDELLNLKAEAAKAKAEAEAAKEAPEAPPKAAEPETTLTEADLDGFEEILSDEDIPF